MVWQEENQKDLYWSDYWTKHETTLLRYKSLKKEHQYLNLQIVFIHAKCLVLEWALQQENNQKQYSEATL